MGKWIFSAFIVGLEVAGALYFFNIFMEKKEVGKLKNFKFPIYFVILFGAAILDEWIGMFKVILTMLCSLILNVLYYKVTFARCLFFTVLEMSMAFLADYVWLTTGSMLKPDMLVDDMRNNTVILPLIAKTFWLLILLLVSKIKKYGNDYRMLTEKEWLQLTIIPGFTLIAQLFMFFSNTKDINVQKTYLLFSVGLIIINFLVIYIMQDILDKEGKIRVGMLTNQNQKNQLYAYADMESVYQHQRMKMHDYKNQLRTIQTLIRGDDIGTALAFTEKLTESISVDMSAVNTNHPVINAVLNQKCRSMQEKNISLILKVGDLHEVCLEEEEIVILLSNLLDNAIRASERVLRKKKKAVIRLKMVYEDDSMILSVKNPVMEKVKIIDDMVQTEQSDGHGIGLLNVKAVVDKYQGDMVLSCDDNEFKVVIVL